VKFRVKASATVASTKANALTTGRFLSDRTTGLKFGSGAYVSFGSKADIKARPANVCFTPKSGHC
jgi:hypothetical protein